MIAKIHFFICIWWYW